MIFCVFGMDNGIGPIKYGDFREHVHVRYDAPAQDILSPETAREIDLAVRELMLKAHNRAVEILEKEHDRLEKLAQALLERETLTYKEVVALLGLPDKDAAVEVAPGEIAPGEASGSDCVEPEAETGSVPAESAE